MPTCCATVIDPVIVNERGGEAESMAAKLGLAFIEQCARDMRNTL